MDVLLQVVATSLIDLRSRVLDHLLQVGLVDGGHLVGLLVVLTISLVEIHFGQEGGTGSLRGATLVGLRRRQHLVSPLQVLGNLCPALVVGELGVRDLTILIVGKVGAQHERNLLEKALQLEMGVGAQEAQFGQPLLFKRVAVVAVLDGMHGGIHA